MRWLDRRERSPGDAALSGDLAPDFADCSQELVGPQTAGFPEHDAACDRGVAAKRDLGLGTVVAGRVAFATLGCQKAVSSIQRRKRSTASDPERAIPPRVTRGQVPAAGIRGEGSQPAEFSPVQEFRAEVIHSRGTYGPTRLEPGPSSSCDRDRARHGRVNRAEERVGPRFADHNLKEVTRGDPAGVECSFVGGPGVGDVVVVHHC